MSTCLHTSCGNCFYQMHDLIRNYRETRNVVLDMESKLILQVAPNKLYDNLPAMHKLEVE